MYYDDYGRLRMNANRNPRVVATTFAEWQDRINPQTSAAPTSAAPTSAAPTSGGTTDESQGAAAGGGSDGGDVRDNAIHNMSLPEYSNARDWVDAVMGTPSVMGPGMIADAIVGRGLFDPTMDRSYTTRSGELMNAEQPSHSDIRNGRDLANPNTSTPRDEGDPDGIGINGPQDKGSRSANDPDGIGINGPSVAGPSVETNDGTGWDMAEGGEVFNSPEQVPGPVAGPGGPKDDMVDANLSNGEFVSTAEATQTFGQDFLTQLNDIARAPEAQGLTANPAFEQSKQEFIQKISEMVAPQQGAAPPQPGMMAPPPGMAPPQNPAQPGFAEGGRVSEPATVGEEIIDAIKVMSLMGKRMLSGDMETAREDLYRHQKMKGIENSNPNERPLLKGKSPPGFAEGGRFDEGVWTPSTQSEMDKARRMDLEDGKFSKSTQSEMDKARRMDLEDGKMSKATPSELKKARKGMSGMRDAKSAPPKGPGLMADPAARVAGPTAMPEDEMVNAVSKRVLMGLMARMIPGVGGVVAGMTPGDTNEGEAEELAKALKDPQRAMTGNIKESRTKDDTAGLMAPSSDIDFEEEKALFESSKKLKDSKKPSLKIDISPKPKTKAMDKSSTKKTSSEGNKLAPGASLGDALAFYKSKGASTFEWDGDTYVKSNSNSGYSVKN